MDLYLASAEPGLTLQEMIDFDIKSGLDFDTDSLMTSIDLSAMTSLEADLALRPFDALFDPLEEGGEDPRPSASPVASWMNLSAMTNFNLDAETSLMVDPSAVLPSPLHRGGAAPSPPPTPRHPSSPPPAAPRGALTPPPASSPAPHKQQPSTAAGTALTSSAIPVYQTSRSAAVSYTPAR